MGHIVFNGINKHVKVDIDAAERLRLGDVEYENESICATQKRGGDRPESLFTSGVPERHTNLGVLDDHLVGEESGANCWECRREE